MGFKSKKGGRRSVANLDFPLAVYSGRVEDGVKWRREVSTASLENTTAALDWNESLKNK